MPPNDRQSDAASDPEHSEPAAVAATADSFRLGEWRVEPSLNRIVHGDAAVAIEPKVMEVLLVLVRNAERLTSRADLLREVWNDAYLGEDPTTRAVSELRKALGDSARQPQYIETIHGKGYRLIAPVEALAVEADVGTAERTVAAASAVVPTGASSTPAPGRAPDRRRPSIWIGVATLAGLATVLYLSSRQPELPREPDPVSVTRTTVTSFPGREIQPALSPDGSRVAFSWSGGIGSGGAGSGADGNELDIYLKQANTGQPVRLTETPYPEWGPVWSADGTRIAFVRLDDEGCGIFALPAIGGAELLLTRCEQAWLGFDWSPDDRFLIVADRDDADSEVTRIWWVDLVTGERLPLTEPPPPHHRDTSPRISPDGEWVAFRRKLGEGQFEIFLIPSTGGEERQLTFERQDNGGLDWAPDSRSIVFSSNRGGLFSLWRVSFYGEVEPLGIEDAYLPSAADRADRLVFEKRSLDLDLWQVANPFVEPATGAVHPEGRRWSTSTQPELDPQFSPDGAEVAFVSQRSGSYELWIAAADGTGSRQLTSFSQPAPGWSAAVQHPRWSRDGRQVLFSARADGDFDVFTVRSHGGVPHPITSHVADDISPVWMAEGAWVYFVSNRTGRWEIWRLAPDRSRPEQVTDDGVEPVIDTQDGERLFYQRGNELHALEISTGRSEPLLDFGYIADWGLAAEGVYYLSRQGVGFFDLATRTKRQLPLPPGPPPAGGSAISRSGLALSPDGRTLIYAGSDRAETDIVLITGLFR